MKNPLACFFLVAYLGVLFGTLAIAPGLWMSANTRTSGALSNLLPILGIMGFGFFYGMLIKKKGFGAHREIALLTLIAICYGALFFFSAAVPLEQYHLVEYGILSALVYMAASPYGGFNTVVPWGLLVVIAIGIADEACQWYLPGRFFDIRDIFLNAVSSLLSFALLGLFVVRTPEKVDCPSGKN